MKKKLFLLLVLALSIALKSGALLNAQTLDEAILNAAVKISRDLPEGSTVAVINFSSVSGELNAYAVSELHGAIVRNRRVTSVRTDQEQIRRNIPMRFTREGDLTAESAQQAGEVLGVQYLITGLLQLTGSESEYRIVISAVDTDAQLQSQYTAMLNLRGDAQLASLLGIAPIASQQGTSQRRAESRQKPIDRARLNTIGVSAGSSFIDPVVIATVRGTIAPTRYWFIEAGLDIGLVSIYKDVESYFSLYPFVHTGFFVPFRNRGGLYIGAGAGFMTGQYAFFYGKAPVNTFAADFIAGINIVNSLDISYTLRTNFDITSPISNKLSIGYVYRF